MGALDSHFLIKPWLVKSKREEELASKLKDLGRQQH